MMGIAVLLLALGFGYKVFADATADSKKGLRTLGRSSGLFIMIASVGAMVLSAACMSKYCPMGSKGGMGGKGMMGKKFCPFSGGQNQSLPQPGSTVTTS